MRKAIEIGARVLDSEETAAERRLRARASSRPGSASSTSGSAARSRRAPSSSPSGSRASFDAERDGSVQAQIEEIVDAALDEQREALLQLLTAEDGLNPLVDFKDAIGKRCSRS